MPEKIIMMTYGMICSQKRAVLYLLSIAHMRVTTLVHYCLRIVVRPQTMHIVLQNSREGGKLPK